ncbi:uncharacterized protein LOC106011851 [Aplysia californica]|uniref:Uncharacterized protein LOC106011851 n=1 Tax=Aplysia californica TaxID=6500 RepID=A0ABM1A0K1_APLCA|nr:uncharacterized protein LOC106011851 [Aplysia californica]
MAPKVVDLDDVLTAWAWTAFLRTRSKDHNKLTFDDVKFEVVWDRVKFLAGKPEYSDQQKLEKPNSQVVFKSVYENKTDHFQEHTFQTERSTVSSCSTVVSKGYTKGIRLELKLGLPDDVMAATAGFGRDVSMETTDECTHEETITWTINSSIKVPPHHRTVAELVVKEQEYTASFKMSTRIRGHVVVVLTNLRDNNSFLKAIEGDFCDVMSSPTAEQYSKNFTVNGKTVTWDVSGTCEFRFGIEQHVQLSEFPLSEVVISGEGD